MFDNIKAVIFDLDGTLIDSMWLWKSIDIEYLKRYNIELPHTLQDEIEGMSFTETALYFKERFNLDEDIDEIKSVWNEMAWEYYMNKVTLKDDVVHLLTYLKENNIKLGIATSNSKELVSVIVKRFNLHEFFDTVRTSCEVDKGKPAPDIYLKVAEDLEVDPINCIVFEDVLNGIHGGKNAGMRVCGIYDDFSKHVSDKIKAAADYYIEGYHEIVEFLIEGKNNERFSTN